MRLRISRQFAGKIDGKYGSSREGGRESDESRVFPLTAPRFSQWGGSQVARQNRERLLEELCTMAVIQYLQLN